MKNTIHPTAQVSKSARLGTNNYIGPFCNVYGNVVMGDNNHFEGYVSIGSPAEKHGYFDDTDEPKTYIGNGNRIREFVTINSGTRRSTIMGNKCVMLRGSHLSHDSTLEDEVTVSCTVMIGGESHIMTGCNLGLGALLHQFSIVGSYCMVGMGAVCTKKVKFIPGGIFVGNPAKYLRNNTIGLERNGITETQLEQEESRWRAIQERNNG